MDEIIRWRCYLAAMIYWGLKFLFAQKPKKTAFYALLFCFLIEFSQLYHEPWIDQIRNTRLGGLVLGFGFLWSDLVCYLVGVFGSYLVDKNLEGFGICREGKWDFFNS